MSPQSESMAVVGMRTLVSIVHTWLTRPFLLELGQVVVTSWYYSLMSMRVLPSVSPQPLRRTLTTLSRSP
jgi:hypothetical protein